MSRANRVRHLSQLPAGVRVEGSFLSCIWKVREHRQAWHNTDGGSLHAEFTTLEEVRDHIEARTVHGSWFTCKPAPAIALLTQISTFLFSGSAPPIDVALSISTTELDEMAQQIASWWRLQLRNYQKPELYTCDRAYPARLPFEHEWNSKVSRTWIDELPKPAKQTSIAGLQQAVSAINSSLQAQWEDRVTRAHAEFWKALIPRK